MVKAARAQGIAIAPADRVDARAFLARGTDRYDYLILDVFNGDTTPGHLLSLEAMRLAKARLSDKGVVAINLIGSLGAHAQMTHSMINTLRAVFANVAVYPLFLPKEEEAAGNMVLIAYDGAPRSSDAGEIHRLAIHPMAAALVRPALVRPMPLPAHMPAAVLTDDYNPLDVRDLWIKEWLRKAILDTTHIDILLG